MQYQNMDPSFLSNNSGLSAPVTTTDYTSISGDFLTNSTGSVNPALTFSGENRIVTCCCCQYSYRCMQQKCNKANFRSACAAGCAKTGFFTGVLTGSTVFLCAAARPLNKINPQWLRVMTSVVTWLGMSVTSGLCGSVLGSATGSGTGRILDCCVRRHCTAPAQEQVELMCSGDETQRLRVKKSLVYFPEWTGK